MNKDGFSYPINEYLSPYRGKCYVYQCHLCGSEIFPYSQKRVRWKITCTKCRNKIAREKYKDMQRILWMQNILEN